MNRKAFIWWRSLSINEMKAYEIKYNSFTFRGVVYGREATPHVIVDIYRKEHLGY